MPSSPWRSLSISTALVIQRPTLLQTFDILEEDVLQAAAIGEIERCGMCDWWDETSNFNSNGNYLDCEPDDGEG